jgi:tRNA A-37 threonylcarbamoyl transferase component Bud32
MINNVGHVSNVSKAQTRLETCPTFLLPARAWQAKVKGILSFLNRLRIMPMDPRSEQATESYLTPPRSDVVPPALADHPRYKVLRVLGQGGMGTVYLAEHRKMERQVALKVIHPKLLQDESAVSRFQREVKAAAKLHHPNIVLAYDADEAGQSPTLHFLAMELVQGQNLADYLRQQGKLSVTDACHCVRQAALGLQHAYEQGMVHRDIKPHNLLRLPSGHIKILDFGLAKFVRQQTPVEPADQLTQTGMILGTVDYLAPEQTGGSQGADIRADIYSLGCTLYQLLTGQLPFPDGTVGDKLSRHARDTPRSVSTFRSDVPPGLEAVLARMMAKRPEDRYQTPAEVAAALAPYAGDAVSLASATMVRADLLPAVVPVTEPPSPAKPVPWFFRRTPWWALVVCAFGIGLCLVPYEITVRGVWGVEYGENDHWGEGKGVLINKVTPRSPAAIMGLREGMRVMEINGVTLRDMDQLRQLLRHLRSREQVKVSYASGNKLIETTWFAPMEQKTYIGYMGWNLFAGIIFSVMGLILLTRETTRPSPWWRTLLLAAAGIAVATSVAIFVRERVWAVTWQEIPQYDYHWTENITVPAVLTFFCGVALVLLAVWEIRSWERKTTA